MHWIYIIRCINDIIYIGETERLFRRLNEHKTSCGSITTKEHKPIILMGVYKLIKDGLTLEDLYAKDLYDNGEISENKLWALALENKITLMYMKAMNIKWNNVYGGKYHSGYRPSKNPSEEMNLSRPYCKCKIPADIHEYKGKKYWRCCRKNIWDGLNDYVVKQLKFYDVNYCDFYKEYKRNDTYYCDKFIYNKKETVQFKCGKCEKYCKEIQLKNGKLYCRKC